MCPICKEAAPYEEYECRVCGATYHKKCIVSSGHFTEAEVDALDPLYDRLGWSCLNCVSI